MMMNPKPFAEWTVNDMRIRLEMVQECLEVWGIQASRELMEKLGFPIPPPELIEPIDVLEKRRAMLSTSTDPQEVDYGHY